MLGLKVYTNTARLSVAKGMAPRVTALHPHSYNVTLQIVPSVGSRLHPYTLNMCWSCDSLCPKGHQLTGITKKLGKPLYIGALFLAEFGAPRATQGRLLRWSADWGEEVFLATEY